MLRTSGRRIDMSTPFVDATLPDGSRLHVVIPGVTRRHMAANIRKFVLQAHSLDELVALGTLTPHAARFLEAAVRPAGERLRREVSVRRVSPQMSARAQRGDEPSPFLATVAAGPLVALDLAVDERQPTLTGESR